MPLTILFVRHGQSSNNVVELLSRDGSLDKHEAKAFRDTNRNSDPHLTEIGLKQAEYLGEELLQRTKKGSWMLVTSPMHRCLLTSKPFVDKIRVRIHDTQRKSPESGENSGEKNNHRDSHYQFVCHGDMFEVGGCRGKDSKPEPGKTSEEISTQWGYETENISSNGWFSGRQRAETCEEAVERIEKAAGWLIRELKRMSTESGWAGMVVVTHGGFSSLLLKSLLSIPLESKMSFVHGNGSITSCTYSSKGLLLSSVNELAHIPVDLQTGGQPDAGWWACVPTYMPNKQTPSILRLDGLEGWSAHFDFLAQTNHLRHKYLIKPQEGITLDDYRDSDARVVHFIAQADYEVAGYVQYDPQTNRLRQLVVPGIWRSRTIGALLVNRVKAEAVARNQEELVVHAWVQSAPFYEKMNFAPRGADYTSHGMRCRVMVCSFSESGPSQHSVDTSDDDNGSKRRKQ